MARLATKTPASARGYGDRRGHEHAILPRLSLTFGPGRGLPPAILGKRFFSTGRPAPETGGQRPTARCALGRKSVWNIVLALRRDILGRHHPPTGRANARPMTGSGGRSSIRGRLA